ncbi:unnamed protein product [Protopolystoma xenopodis]|uniref:Uncharacterized protein n=1 Tax=Protopolystoma xenopodis TaxID=117903 RepID=A0A448XCY3_9PLAT|nr:unnamed protein product [Protopolystoma xenopodis]
MPLYTGWIEGWASRWPLSTRRDIESHFGCRFYGELVGADTAGPFSQRVSDNELCFDARDTLAVEARLLVTVISATLGVVYSTFRDAVFDKRGLIAQSRNVTSFALTISRLPFVGVSTTPPSDNDQRSWGLEPWSLLRLA